MRLVKNLVGSREHAMEVTSNMYLIGQNLDKSRLQVCSRMRHMYFQAS